MTPERDFALDIPEEIEEERKTEDGGSGSNIRNDRYNKLKTHLRLDSLRE